MPQVSARITLRSTSVTLAFGDLETMTASLHEVAAPHAALEGTVETTASVSGSELDVRYTPPLATRTKPGIEHFRLCVTLQLGATPECIDGVLQQQFVPAVAVGSQSVVSGPGVSITDFGDASLVCCKWRFSLTFLACLSLIVLSFFFCHACAHQFYHFVLYSCISPSPSRTVSETKVATRKTAST